VAKTYKNLWSELVSFENLLSASRKAQKGKRFRDSTALFNLNLEKELFKIRRDLISRTYRPGGYKEFVIFEPVKRLISAAPYRDRVVHHALCNVIDTIFEKSFIYDSYANRKEKGTHRAIDRFQTYMQKHRYVLKCDIRKYFPSIDHEILYGLLQRKIADNDVLWLIRTIIESSNPQEPVCDYFEGDGLFEPLDRRKGLPIGNLTSQFFGNVYLNGFDHYIKDTIGCKAYLRYVDDFAVFSNDKKELWAVKSSMDEYLQGLRLKLHVKKTRIFPVNSGCEFLGFYVYPHFRKVKKANVRLFEGRLRALQAGFRKGRKTLEDIRCSIQGWIAHAEHANSYGLRERIFEKYVFCNSPTPLLR
jgi:retron-type reverse transcriptase